MNLTISAKRGFTDSSAGPGSSSIAIIYVVLVAASLIPIASVRFPESADYINHLGRIFVLMVPGDHVVRTFYTIDWRLIPNLGIELLVLGLNKLMPLEAAMKAGWILIFLGLPAAFFLFYYSLNKRIGSPLLLATLCLFNFPLTAGFLSYSLGLAAALAIVGLWLRSGGRPELRNLVLLNAAGSVVLIIHFAAFGALVFTIFCLHALRAPWRLAAIIRRSAIAACGFLAPFALLVHIDAQREHQVPQFLEWSLSDKILLLSKPVFSGIPSADVIGITALMISLFIFVRLGSARCDPRLAPTLLAWLLALLLLPAQIDHAAVVDTRLALFPMLLLFASLHEIRGRLQWIVSGIIIISVLARVVLIKHDWAQYNSDLSGLRALGQVIEPGSKIFIDPVANGSGNCGEPFRWQPFYEHPSVLLMIDRNAFVPILFAKSGMQPIQLSEQFHDLAPGRENYEYLLRTSINCAAEEEIDKKLTFLGKSNPYRLYKISRDPNN